jgi:hypothetical protein
MNHMETAKELEAQTKNLHARIDDAVKERLYAAAAEISGVPLGTLKSMFIEHCRSGYCRCRAIRNIVAGEDGL